MDRGTQKVIPRPEQKELKHEVKDYTRAIDLNDASMNELVAVSSKTSSDSSKWVQINARLHDVRKEMDQLGGPVQKQSDYWEQFPDDFAATFLTVNLY